MSILVYLAILIQLLSALACVAQAAFIHRSPNTSIRRDCQALNTSFDSSSIISRNGGSAPFEAISPESSYKVSESGLELYLRRPQSKVTTQGGINDIVADGATINSTFTLLYGRVSFQVQAPEVAGVVTAVILTGDSHDEIDIEFVGGDPTHWQSNVYAPSRTDTQPLWGIFGEIEDVGRSSSIASLHTYTIDWTSESIVWSIDGRIVRTLTPQQTVVNGSTHFPSHESHISLGIWDASNPQGTAEWAKGPINWQEAPETMTAVIKSVVVECNT